MSYEVTKDNNSKNACYGYVVTGYLKAWPADKKIADGIDPTVQDFMEEIQKIVNNAKILGINSGVGHVEQGWRPPESDETGSMHWQGYYQFKKKQKFSTFQNKLAKVCGMTWRLEEAHGSAARNVEYCTKPTGPWTYASGVVKESITLSEPVWINQDGFTMKKGKRNDLAAVNKAIDDGASMEDLCREFPSTFVRSYKGLGERVFRRDMKIAESREVIKKCYLLFGPTGTGKTQDVLTYTFPKMFGFKKEEVFVMDGGNGKKLWFDGYDIARHRVLLIDELEPAQIPRTTLLRLLDNVQFRGETKGGFTPVHIDYLFITSNYTPEELFLKKHTSFAYNEDGQQYRNTEWVYDDAMENRFDELCNYSGKPNYRQQVKHTRTVMMNDAKAVASLLPATLAFGTEGDESQCGSERVQPSPNGPQAPKNGKNKIQLTIHGDRDDSEDSTLAPYAKGRLY